MSKTTLLYRVLLGGIALAFLAGPAVAEPPAYLGELRNGDLAVVNHRLEPQKLIENPALITTMEQPALLFLDNGRALKLAPGSAARLEDSGSGDIALKVLAGRVYLSGRNGEVRIAGAGGTVRVSPATSDETGLFLDTADEPVPPLVPHRVDRRP